MDGFDMDGFDHGNAPSRVRSPAAGEGATQPGTGSPAAGDGATRPVTDSPEAGGPETGRPVRQLPSIPGYRILRLIGEGGMGSVYEAEEDQPHRKLALKVIRGGAHVTEYQVHLFQREIDSLARLSHPSIAAIHEAGRTPLGQHFFTMELVEGITLSEHVREAAPLDGPRTRESIRRRLHRFLEICDAIQYAHQRGVIHRDLKPANVLVVADSSQGEEPGADPAFRVKVLDFGLARITDGDVTRTSLASGVAHIKGTLAYMSPEQARGDPHEIDTRTDVYSLGVILYELLTGERPYDIHRGSVPEALRIICEEEPRRPSAIRRVLRGDLETIVLKAIEKDPERRYATVAGLAEDIRRTLSAHPILARPPSTAYQIRKLVARHRVPVAFAALLAILVTGSAVTMAILYEGQRQERARADAERQRAVQEAVIATDVTDYLIEVFKVSDPNQAQGETVTALELLNRGADRVSDDLGRDAAVRTRLMAAIGTVYRNLGLFDRSEELLERALEASRSAEWPDRMQQAEILADLAVLVRLRGDHVSAVSHATESLAIRRSELGPDDLLVAQGLHDLGGIYIRSGQPEEAERTLREALRVREKVLGPVHVDVSKTVGNLAIVYQQLEDDSRAEECFRRSYAIKEQTLGPDHLDTSKTLTNLGEFYVRRGRAAEAEPLLTQALATKERVLGPDHPGVASTAITLGACRHKLGKYEDAERLYLQAIAVREAHDPGYPGLPRFYGNLARLYRDMGRPREAVFAYARMFEFWGADAEPTTPGLQQALQEYLACLQELEWMGEAAKVESTWSRAVAMRDPGE